MGLAGASKRRVPGFMGGWPLTDASGASASRAPSAAGSEWQVQLLARTNEGLAVCVTGR